jgi:hypothetical protein
MTGFSSLQPWSVLTEQVLCSTLTVKQTTDKDEEVTLTGVNLQSLGKIRVEFFRGTEGLEIPPSACVIAPNVGVAAEKSKK